MCVINTAGARLNPNNYLWYSLHCHHPLFILYCLGNNIYDQVEVRSATYLPNNAKSKCTSCNIKQAHTLCLQVHFYLWMWNYVWITWFVYDILSKSYHGGYEATLHNNDIAQLNNCGHWLHWQWFTLWHFSVFIAVSFFEIATKEQLPT